MKNYKKVKPILVETRDENFIFICNDDYLQYDINKGENYAKKYIKYQHLYFVCDDKIKAGDWYYFYPSKFNENFDIDWCVKQALINNENLEGKKIVASTNKILELPLISETWIKETFLRNQNRIKEINLETETINIFSSIPSPNQDFKKIERLCVNNYNEVIINNCYYNKDENIFYFNSKKELSIHEIKAENYTEALNLLSSCVKNVNDWYLDNKCKNLTTKKEIIENAVEFYQKDTKLNSVLLQEIKKIEKQAFSDGIKWQENNEKIGQMKI